MSLRDRNTFRVEAHAACFARVASEAALAELLARTEVAQLPILVLGEGSNILFADDFPGLVIALDLKQREVLGDDETEVRVCVGAGVRWDPFVDWSLAQGACGLENLALIPGHTGAAPIQNIGAYGVEIGTYLEAVTAWDSSACRYARLERKACQFAYRDSIFKREPHRFIVTSMELRLPRSGDLELGYPGVREELVAIGATEPTAKDVATAIRRLRRRKLPDPVEIGNAGSFFKNPVVPRTFAEHLRERHPGLPVYPTADGSSSKLAAAWLIEACGLKGHRDGDAGVSTQHALVLVNHGNATGAQILALAERVADAVEQRFGVQLEPEPRIIRART